ncbi:MAG: hypothetical protein WA783_04765 [Phormidesmis sp.]
MNRYLAKLSQSILLATFFTAISTLSYAASLPTVNAANNSDVETSLSYDLLAEKAIARTQNETVESNLSQHFRPFN